jgi:hypothetical protein
MLGRFDQTLNNSYVILIDEDKRDLTGDEKTLNTITNDTIEMLEEKPNRMRRARRNKVIIGVTANWISTGVLIGLGYGLNDETLSVTGMVSFIFAIASSMGSTFCYKNNISCFNTIRPLNLTSYSYSEIKLLEKNMDNLGLALDKELPSAAIIQQLQNERDSQFPNYRLKVTSNALTSLGIFSNSLMRTVGKIVLEYSTEVKPTGPSISLTT